MVPAAKLHLTGLPPEVLLNIISHLPCLDDFYRLSATNKQVFETFGDQPTRYVCMRRLIVSKIVTLSLLRPEKCAGDN